MKIMKKLDELFNLPENTTVTSAKVIETLTIANDTLDKIEDAMPYVRGLDSTDEELDELANLAKESFQDLSNLGMQVDSRYAGELFSVAGTMLGHAISAKTAKINRKLKTLDLQMKKLALDQKQKPVEEEEKQSVTSTFDRNALLKQLQNK